MSLGTRTPIVADSGVTRGGDERGPRDGQPKDDGITVGRDAAELRVVLTPVQAASDQDELAIGDSGHRGERRLGSRRDAVVHPPHVPPCSATGCSRCGSAAQPAERAGSDGTRQARRVDRRQRGAHVRRVVPAAERQAASSTTTSSPWATAPSPVTCQPLVSPNVVRAAPAAHGAAATSASSALTTHRRTPGSVSSRSFSAR